MMRLFDMCRFRVSIKWCEGQLSTGGCASGNKAAHIVSGYHASICTVSPDAADQVACLIPPKDSFDVTEVGILDIEN